MRKISPYWDSIPGPSSPLRSRYTYYSSPPCPHPEPNWSMLSQSNFSNHFKYYPPIHALFFQDVCFLQISPSYPYMHISPPHYVSHVPQILSLVVWLPQNLLRRTIMKLLIMKFSPVSCLLLTLKPKYLLSTTLSNTLRRCSTLNVRDQNKRRPPP